MAKKSNGTKALVVGTVLGLVAGAAYALWKTPMSGKDLRNKLSTAAAEATGSVAGAGAGLSDKVLHAVETTLAPIVGVELGKTASGSEPAAADSSETGPITAAESPPVESNGHAAPVYGTSSIRAQRFAWGTPAPEATKVAPVAPQPPAAPVAPAAPAETAKPVEADATASTYGTESIRAQRYGWGTPAPEATKAAVVAPQTPEAAPVEPVAKVETPEVPAASAAYGANSIRAQRSTWGTPSAEAATATAVAAPVANDTVSAPVSVSVEETREMEPVAVSAPVNGMHPFPKLGGLE